MRIVFASLGSLGDLHPILAVARGCADKGHSVVIAAPRNFAGYITGLGFEFCGLRPEFGTETLVQIFTSPRRGAESLLRKTVFPAVRETYEDLLAAARGADFLVAGELVYVAPLVAEVLGLRWGNVLLSPQSFLSAVDPCVLCPLPELFALRHLGRWPYRLVFALGRWKTTQWARPLLALQNELGLAAEVNTVFEGKYSPHLVLTLFPALLAAEQVDWPGKVVQTGFPFFGQEAKPEVTRQIADFMAAGEAPIVFTLGSTVVHLAKDFYEMAAEAARVLDRRAILLIGTNAAPDAPVDRVLAMDYAPLEMVLPGAAAVVHHGGVGSCAEVLRAGVPALIVPFGFDQPDNAERLRRRGVARVLRRDRVTVARLVENLRVILADEAMAARAREVARGIDAAGDLARSVAAIEVAAGI